MIGVFNIKEFAFDLKIFHRWVGKILLKMYAKFIAIALLMSLLFLILNLLIVTAVPWSLVMFIPTVAVFGSVLSYFAMFLDERSEIKEVKKEIHMERKYSSMFTKFNKTF